MWKSTALELIDMQQHAPRGSRGMLFIRALRDEVWHGLLCGSVCVHDHAAHRNTHTYTHTDTSHRYVPNLVGNSCPSQRAVRNAVLLLQHNESRPGPSCQQLERGVCWVCSTHAHVEHWVFPCLLGFRLPSLGLWMLPITFKQWKTSLRVLLPKSDVRWSLGMRCYQGK